MPEKRCRKCGKDVDRTFSCEHTSNEELCVYCYQELHHELTNS